MNREEAHNYNVMKNLARKAAAAEANHHDDIDFAMLDLPTRPGPAKAATAPEQEPVERRMEREREAAPHIAAALEVQHGSGNVKV